MVGGGSALRSAAAGTRVTNCFRQAGAADRFGLLTYSALCLIWGSTWLVIKVGYGGLGPLTVASLRFVLAGTLLTILVPVLGARWPSGRVEWLLVLWVGAWQFLEWLRLAAGATAIVVALITLPMYRAAQRDGAVRDPAWTLGRWGSPPMLALALLTLVLMAAGSLVSVK